MNESALGDVPLADLSGVPARGQRPAQRQGAEDRWAHRRGRPSRRAREPRRNDASPRDGRARHPRRAARDEQAVRHRQGELHPLPDEEVRSVAASAKWEPEEPVGSAQPATAPAKTVAEVVDTFKRWLYLPEPDVLLAVLGTFAANHLPGEPVWLVVVGPPGGGKTEPLRAVTALPDAYATGTLTESSLLSGSPKRERPATAKGGLLREIGGFGLIVAKDFGSVLSSTAKLEQPYLRRCARSMTARGRATWARTAARRSSGLARWGCSPARRRASTATTRSCPQWASAFCSSASPMSIARSRRAGLRPTPGARRRCGGNLRQRSSASSHTASPSPANSARRTASDSSHCPRSCPVPQRGRARQPHARGRARPRR